MSFTPHTIETLLTGVIASCSTRRKCWLSVGTNIIHWLRLVFHPKTEKCPDMECSLCAERDCPFGEPLHYHHDGCPCCDMEIT